MKANVNGRKVVLDIRVKADGAGAVYFIASRPNANLTDKLFGESTIIYVSPRFATLREAVAAGKSHAVIISKTYSA